MKLKLIILLSILTYSKLLPVNLEISFGGGVGGSTEFSYTEGFNHIPSENGSRVNSGFSANGFLDIGANFELPNAGALSSISLLFETGYNFYIRTRTADISDEQYEKSLLSIHL